MAKRRASQNVGRTLLEKYPVSELLMFRAVLQEMLRSSQTTVLDAVTKVSAAMGSSFRTNKQKELSIRTLLEVHFGIRYLTKIGGNRSYLTERYRGVAIDLVDALSLLDESIGLLSGALDVAKGSVSIGTLVSVVNYLGPAFLALFQRVSGRSGVIAHADFFHADFDLNVQRLNYKEIDFVLDQDTDVPLPPNIDKLAVPMQAGELGVVFRLSHPSNERARLFPKLFNAAANGRVAELVSEIASVPLLLTNPAPTSRPDPSLNEVNKALFKINQQNGDAPVVTLPTSRTIRHFVRMGLGVGVGHKPRDQSKRNVKIAKNSVSHGVLIGCDVEAPEVDLVFVPLSMLKLAAPPPTRFALYYRRKSPNAPRQTKANADLDPVPLLAMNCFIALITNQLGDFGYLRFDENKVAHDFHFGDDPHVIVPEKKIDMIASDLRTIEYFST